MLKLTLIFCLLFGCLNANADNWTPTQKTLGGILLTTTAVDFLQTRNILRMQDRFYETNAILGEYPSRRRVNVYFALVPVVGFFALNALPGRYRTPALVVLNILEAGTVGHNFYLGINARF